MAIIQDVSDVSGKSSPNKLVSPMLQPVAAPESSSSEAVRSIWFELTAAPVSTTKYVVSASRSMPAVVPVTVSPLWESVSAPKLPSGLPFEFDDSMRTSSPVMSVPRTGNDTPVSV